jgi:hypothetical protein
VFLKELGGDAKSRNQKGNQPGIEIFYDDQALCCIFGNVFKNVLIIRVLRWFIQKMIQLMMTRRAEVENIHRPTILSGRLEDVSIFQVFAEAGQALNSAPEGSINLFCVMASPNQNW